MPDESPEIQPEPQEQPGAAATELTPPELEATEGTDEDTFPRDYVEKLRQESAGYRKRAQEAESKLKEHEQAQMSEVDKAKTQATEASQKAEQLERLLQNERTRNAVALEATRMQFRDPLDAISLIDLEDLNYDEETGKPSTKSVQGALTKLANSKPYLVGEEPLGSAEGGARGGTGDLTREQRVEARARELQEKKGTLPAPVGI